MKQPNIGFSADDHVNAPRQLHYFKINRSFSLFGSFNRVAGSLLTLSIIMALFFMASLPGPAEASVLAEEKGYAETPAFGKASASVIASVPDSEPGISVTRVNTTTVGRYEKFELWLDLHNVEIENPFDPADIDVYALFTAPSGREIRINGFYDNYREADQWKLRFSPNETGRYEYRFYVNDAGRAGPPVTGSFEAVDSEHHGWIRQSAVNPRYFSYDDGTSYYAVGVYSPWRNDQERFETFAKHNANFFGLWNITYGGFIGGAGLIEEELGRYNQEKCGRIDSLMKILEKDDIKLMFAIWPHDLFSATVWATMWDRNPYRHLIDVVDVYSDSLVFEYQKRKYRYLIARYAHSRSWGLWEIINEMNGTDGWARGRHQEGFDWVRKTQQYFTENDPYGHPVTASFSGGFDQYRRELHEIIDIPNLHLYPTQGWEIKYPGDTLRSAMFNYAWAARRFWDEEFMKPAIFGESGAEWEYFPGNSREYRLVYHNAIWASLTNGLAGIPVWWDYTFLVDEDWMKLKYLRRFTGYIDFANLPFEPAAVSAEGADVYVMDAGSEAFGWVRNYSKDLAEGTVIELEMQERGRYTVSWFDTWSGEVTGTERVRARNGKLQFTVPALPEPHPDVAFRIVKD